MTSTSTQAGRRDELVREHLPLIGHVVAQIAGRAPARLPREQLTSAGLLALTAAARAFDPAAGAPFAPFALTRIRGAVTAELAGTEWDSREPRSRDRELRRARADLAAALGRTASREELAATLGCTTTNIDAHPGSALPQEDGLLRDCVAALPPRLRDVIERHYFAQHRIEDIAADLGVAEPRVLQLRAEALGYVRAAFSAQPDAGADAAGPVPSATRHAATAAARSRLAEHGLLASAVADRTALATA